MRGKPTSRWEVYNKKSKKKKINKKDNFNKKGLIRSASGEQMATILILMRFFFFLKVIVYDNALGRRSKGRLVEYWQHCRDFELMAWKSIYLN